MNEKIKQLFLFLLISFVIFSLGWLGFSAIRKNAEQKLDKLEEEAATTDFESEEVKQSPISVLMPGEPEAEKNSFLYLEAEKQFIAVGETIELKVLIETQAEIVDGVEFILSYNPELISVGELVEGDFFPLYPQKKVDSELGQIRVAAVRDTDEPLNKEIIVILPITGLQKGIAEFSFNREKTHIGAYGGQDLLQEARPLTIEID